MNFNCRRDHRNNRLTSIFIFNHQFSFLINCTLLITHIHHFSLHCERYWLSQFRRSLTLFQNHDFVSWFEFFFNKIRNFCIWKSWIISRSISRFVSFVLYYHSIFIQFDIFLIIFVLAFKYREKTTFSRSTFFRDFRLLRNAWSWTHFQRCKQKDYRNFEFDIWIKRLSSTNFWFQTHRQQDSQVCSFSKI